MADLCERLARPAREVRAWLQLFHALWVARPTPSTARLVAAVSDLPTDELVAAWLVDAAAGFEDERYQKLIDSEEPGSHMRLVWTAALATARFKRELALEREAIRLANEEHEEKFGMAAAIARIERSTEILERAAAENVWIDAAFDTALRQTIQINRTAHTAPR